MIKSTPTWKEGVEKKEYKPLSGDIEVDIVIIGGGIAGVMSAYLLAKAGKKVAILEKNLIGEGTTNYTTAFLTQSLDTNFSDLIKTYGIDGAKEIVSSHGKAVELIEEIIKENSIECDITSCSNYIYAISKKDFKDLEEEKEAAKSIGLRVELYSDGSNLGFPNEGYMEVKNQAKFHPLKFLYPLSEKASDSGVDIYEHTEATNIEQMKERGVRVTTNRGIVTADKVIVATYEPFNQPLSLYFKKAMYVSYVFHLEIEGISLIEGTYEDTGNPYSYMRIDKQGDKKYKVISRK